MYFETQPKGSSICVLCALNNVLGGPRATALEFEQLALRLAIVDRAEANIKEHKFHSEKQVSFYFHHRLSKKGLLGGWSIRIARQWLLDHHVNFEWGLEGGERKTDFATGRFFLRVQVGHSFHAIAIIDNILLDSMREGPLPWPANHHRYRVLNIGRVFPS